MHRMMKANYDDEMESPAQRRSLHRFCSYIDFRAGTLASYHTVTYEKIYVLVHHTHTRHVSTSGSHYRMTLHVQYGRHTGTGVVIGLVMSSTFQMLLSPAGILSSLIRVKLPALSRILFCIIIWSQNTFLNSYEKVDLFFRMIVLLEDFLWSDLKRNFAGVSLDGSFIGREKSQGKFRPKYQGFKSPLGVLFN